MSNLDQTLWAYRVDEITDKALPWVASIPALAFMTTPAIQAFGCWSRGGEDNLSAIYYQIMIFDRLRPIAIACAVVAAVMALWQIVRKQHKLSRGRLAVLATFVVLAVLEVVATLANPDNPNAFDGIPVSNVGMWGHLVLIFAYLLPSAFVTRRGIRRAVCEVVCVTSVVVATYALVKAYGTWTTDYPDGGNFFAQMENLDSIFLHFNFYGYFLATVIPIAAGLFALEQRRGLQVLYLVYLCVNTVVLNLTDTMGSWLACAVMVCVMPVVWRLSRGSWNLRAVATPVVFAAVLAVVTVCGSARMVNSIGTLFNEAGRIVGAVTQSATAEAEELEGAEGAAAEDAGSDAAAEATANGVETAEATEDSSEDTFDLGSVGSNRGKLWSITVQRIADKPLLGWGAEGFYEELREEANSARPHNELLMYAAWFGVPAALVYVGGVVATFALAWRYRRRLDGVSAACLAGVAGYFISSIFGNTMFMTSQLMYVFLGLGLAGIAVVERGENEQPTDQLAA